MSLAVYKEPHDSLVAPSVASLFAPLFAVAGFFAFLVGVGFSFFGFAVGGIAAGSAAAAMQASVGNVVAGSYFAAMQSLGTTGFFHTVATLGGAAATAGFCFYPEGQDDSSTDDVPTDEHDDKDKDL
jgi:hypothetical protein